MKKDITEMEVSEIALLIRNWSSESQEKFAHSVERSISTIAKVETGGRNLYLDTFLRWCKIKGIKVTMEKEKTGDLDKVEV